MKNKKAICAGCGKETPASDAIKVGWASSRPGVTAKGEFNVCSSPCIETGMQKMLSLAGSLQKAARS